MEYVGILVNDRLFQGIPKGNTGHEMLDFYEEAGRQFDLKPCYFRIRDIRPGQDRVKAYIRHKNRYVLRSVPTPAVIHNRSIFQSPAPKSRIDRLAQSGIIVFNGWNRFGKLAVHEHLMKELSIRPHLPCTVQASPAALREMMDMFDSLILKPNSGSIGRGILKLDRAEKGWVLHVPDTSSSRAAIRSITFHPDRPPSLLLRLMREKPYVIQQRLELATHEGKPFDCRVSVQRNETGRWQVTGIAAKVAAKHKYVTNVAQGGTVLPLEQLLEAYPDLVSEQIYNHLCHFSLKAAERLGMHLPRLADIGLDVGITAHGFPVFIECNCRDLRYSFSYGQPEVWKATYRNPLGYARHLLDAKRRH